MVYLWWKYKFCLILKASVCSCNNKKKITFIKWKSPCCWLCLIEIMMENAVFALKHIQNQTDGMVLMGILCRGISVP